MVPDRPAVTWLEHAAGYAAVKWPHLAPHSRAGVADALATITPALTRPAARPPSRRLAARAPCTSMPSTPPAHAPDPAAARALAWLHRASLPLGQLNDPHVVRPRSTRSPCARTAPAPPPPRSAASTPSCTPPSPGPRSPGCSPPTRSTTSAGKPGVRLRHRPPRRPQPGPGPGHPRPGRADPPAN